MNIFILDKDPKINAQYHCDKHVVKMIVEAAQLLSTAHHVLGINCDGIYKKTHENHPCAKWVRESVNNYIYLCEIGLELCKEYEYRYNKIHKTNELLLSLSYFIPKRFIGLVGVGITPFALAMPDQYKIIVENDIFETVVQSYRNYYKNEKKSIANYKNREIPEFLK